MRHQIIKAGIWLLAFFLTFQVYAQIEDTRMQRDIEVLEKVLQQLTSEKKFSSYDYKVKGTYKEGLGIVFHLPKLYWNISSRAFLLDEECDCDDEEEEEEMNKKKVITLDSIHQVKRKELEQMMKNFLMNYGDLATSLKSSEKIMVIYRNDPRFYNALMLNEDENRLNKEKYVLTVSVVKEYVEQYRKGTISKEALISKIEVKEQRRDKETNPDFGILAGIFDNLLKSYDTHKFFSNTEYEYLDDMGIVYETVVWGGNSYNYNFSYGWSPEIYQMTEKNGQYKIMGTNKNVIVLDNFDNKKGKTDKKKQQQEDDAKLKYEKEKKEALLKYEKEQEEAIVKKKQEMKDTFAKFEKDAQEYLIQYGRILRGIKDNETITWKIQMSGKWDKEKDIPQVLELIVKRSVLNQYEQQKISMQEAISQIEIKKK